MTAIPSSAKGGPPEEFDVGITAASPTQATSDGRPLQLLKHIQRFLHVHPTAVPFVVLMTGVVLGLSVNFPRFATADNFSTILLQVTIVGILGIAQPLIVLAGCIDLSVGVIDGLPIILAFPAGLLCGIVFGSS